jgi:hypothetical protein
MKKFTSIGAVLVLCGGFMFAVGSMNSKAAAMSKGSPLTLPAPNAVNKNTGALRMNTKAAVTSKGLLSLPVSPKTVAAPSNQQMSIECEPFCRFVSYAWENGCEAGGGNYWDCWAASIQVYCNCVNSNQCATGREGCN